jgi:DNA-binding beta-propeller fold protein YncE
MVQNILIRTCGMRACARIHWPAAKCRLILAHALRSFCPLLLTGALLLSLAPAFALERSKIPADKPWPELLLEAGRKLTYQQSIQSERDVSGKQGLWSKLAGIVAGPPEFREMVRPYGIAVDSHGRVIVTDPAISAVHIFDVAKRKYKLIDRWDKSKDPMIAPQCVAVDEKDNIYITDSEAGKVFVFDPQGKTRKVFGSLKRGEGFFKRPTGIAIDRGTHRVYVTDTLADRVYILDADGRVLRSFGQHGEERGEFNFPIEVQVKDGVVAVVDAMNFRVQLFDRDGNFEAQIGTSGDPAGGIYRPRGVGIDSEDHIYIVDSELGMVQIFDRRGRLLYRFGNGTNFGQFLLPAGLFIDQNDRVYLVDSYNRRVQVFQYHALQQTTIGVQP